MFADCARRAAFVATLCCTVMTTAVVAAEAVYDPMALAGQTMPAPVDLTVKDAQRQREIPIRVYLPAEKAEAAVVVFSHGLGGSREGSAYLGRHWAGRGYAAVFLQHPGSDTSVWRDEAPGQRMNAMRKAASAENFMLRVKDVPAALDQIAGWNTTKGHALEGRLNMTRVGMSGHSFGAVTTQAVSGESFAGMTQALTDIRIKAAVMFSPSSPRRGDPAQAFGGVRIPWMLMTGTKDIAAIGDADMKSRLAVYPALPPGGKYEVVLNGAEHSAFSDRALPGDTEKRDPNHHRVILALSTAFWDAYLRQDAAARAWLDGDGPATVMEKDDRWQRK